MQEFLEACFSGPVLPASVLLLFVMTYWFFVILGSLDFDLIDFDVDVDHPSGSSLGLGFATLRFLNIGNVPLIVWLTVFAICFWVVAMLIDRSASSEVFSETALAVVRNAGIGLLLTKFLTNPLRGKFETLPPNPAESLVGRTCVITTSEVTATFGQARFDTEAAPLYLNVRATEEPLAKGDIAEIVDFDPEKRLFFVKRTNREVG